MSPLEIALVVLVSIWSLLFIIIAAAMFILLKELKKALDKINNILEDAENVTSGVSAAASGIGKLLVSRRNIAGVVKSITSKSRKR